MNELSKLETKIQVQAIQNFISNELSLILESMYYHKQRKVAPAHVERLKNIMVSGEWKIGSQLYFARIKFKSDTYHFGQLVLMNGYHRVNAAIEYSKPLAWQTCVVEVKSESELDALFYSFDVALKQRTMYQILPTLNFNCLIDALPIKYKSKLMPAVLFIEAEFSSFYSSINGNKLTLSQKAQKVNEWTAEAQTYFNLLCKCNKTSSKFTNVAILAVALFLIREQEKMALEFFEGVLEDDGLAKDDPRKTLLRTLEAVNTRQQRP